MDHSYYWKKFGRNIPGVVVGMGACLFLSASSAMASSPIPMSTRMGLLGGVAKDQPLSSVRLAGIRGKFINGDSVVYFGLCLSSEWNSFAVDANINFNIQGQQPIFEITSSSTNGTTSSGGAPNFSGVFPFNVSYGVKQGIQVAGNGNQVTNTIGINVVPYSGLGSISNPSSLPYSVGYDYGSSASGGVTVNSNGLISLGITVPGDSSSIGQQIIGQQIGPHGISQYAGLNTNLNTVMNNLTLQVGTAAVANPVYMQQLNSLLQNMSGLLH